MLYLYTGTPGSSKSLNAIKFICETDQFKNRPVYYYNISECTLTFNADGSEKNWIELTDDQVNSWYELPTGAVIFIDEAQKVFRPRMRSAAVPRKVEELETHRHKGIDLILCTQSCSIIDSAVLAQCERHTHIERMYQKEEANHFVWQKAVSNVNSKSDRARAVVTTVKFDKNYYGKYKSAVFHTPKVAVPLKIKIIKSFIVAAPAAFIIYFCFVYYNSRFNDQHIQTQSQPHYLNQNTVQSIPVHNSNILNTNKSQPDYMQSRTPRVSGMPWTAPMYDDLQTPVSVPTPDACVHFKTRDICVCYTHQATRISVTESLCLAIVERGFFDPTIARDTGDWGARSAARAPNSSNHVLN